MEEISDNFSSIAMTTVYSKKKKDLMFNNSLPSNPTLHDSGGWVVEGLSFKWCCLYIQFIIDKNFTQHTV